MCSMRARVHTNALLIRSRPTHAQAPALCHRSKFNAAQPKRTSGSLCHQCVWELLLTHAWPHNRRATLTCPYPVTTQNAPKYQQWRPQMSRQTRITADSSMHAKRNTSGTLQMAGKSHVLTQWRLPRNMSAHDQVHNDYRPARPPSSRAAIRSGIAEPCA